MDGIGHRVFPTPFDHIVGSPVYHEVWGSGWLGYTLDQYEEGAHTQLWYYCGKSRTVVQVYQDHICTFEDTWTGHQWLIFMLDGVDYPFPFVLNPHDDCRPRAVHPRLRKFLE